MFFHNAFALVGVLSGGWLSDRLKLTRYGARFELAGAALLLGAPFLVALRAESQGPIYGIRKTGIVDFYRGRRDSWAVVQKLFATELP